MICYRERKQLPLALEDARQGRQALFVHRWLGINTPKAFEGSHLIGKLFDMDSRRLIKTARELGVRIIKIDRINQPGQHIDLVGPPLENALKLVRNYVATDMSANVIPTKQIKP